MNGLFQPLILRGTQFRNRVWAAPLCQYSSVDGHPTDWHLAHLGALARGGVGLVMSEATAITPEGRISPEDAGIWSRAHIQGYARINAFIESQGAVPGIQLAHSGRKGATKRPWEGRGPLDDGRAWPTVAPSAESFDDWPPPHALSTAEIHDLVDAWGEAARHAIDAGYRTIEIHAAHGYLLHEFLSPLANRRSDAYGGSLDNRTRLLREVVARVRAEIPETVPLFVRLSATDWTPGGLVPADIAAVALQLTSLGVDLIDVSSGGLSPEQQISTGPGYQVGFAQLIREFARVPVAAVGELADPHLANDVIISGAADAVFIGRALMRNPHWPQWAARQLEESAYIPEQYLKAW